MIPSMSSSTKCATLSSSILGVSGCHLRRKRRKVQNGRNPLFGGEPPCDASGRTPLYHFHVARLYLRSLLWYVSLATVIADHVGPFHTDLYLLSQSPLTPLTNPLFLYVTTKKHTSKHFTLHFSPIDGFLFFPSFSLIFSRDDTRALSSLPAQMAPLAAISETRDYFHSRNALRTIVEAETPVLSLSFQLGSNPSRTVVFPLFVHSRANTTSPFGITRHRGSHRRSQVLL